MTFCKTMVLGAGLALLGVSAAQAQFGAYGVVNGQRIGGITCPPNAAPCANNNGEVRPFGGDYGVFYDFRDVGPVKLGFDVRGETLVANKRGDSGAGGGKIDRHFGVVAGVRGSFNTRIHILHPYVEILGGLDRNNDTGLYTVTTTNLTTTGGTIATTSLTFNPNTYKNYGVIKGLAGIDVRLGSVVELRAIELGVGEAFGSATNFQSTVVNTAGGSTTTAVSSGPSTHGIQSIGGGIVFRFGRSN